ncbi:hypothetical protein DFH11DRAFT_1507650 [Phellopilus nigrolimitatus]|nr:hypothetical protein DFH11DRAFT_1507650 [Phellopilus nigrolimitatus]
MLSTFFDAIVGQVCTKFNIPKESVRVFSNKHADTPLGDNNGRCLRKPDIAVLGADIKEEDVDWRGVRGCVELKINNKSRAQALRQIRQYARMIFKNQPGRRFVLSATLLNDRMMFIVHDRVGELASEEFNIHDDPERLVRIVVGFAFCAEKNLGYDPSYYIRDGETFIKLDGQEYQVVRDIYVDSSICGRGTLPWWCPDTRSVGKKGNCVLKDVWVDKSRKGKEWDLLEDLEEKNFEGVVRMKFHEEVKVDGKPDTTGADRAKVTRKVERWRTKKEWEHFENLEEREHHFLLLKTLGQPLESFRSKKELISAFRDIFDSTSLIIMQLKLTNR